MRPRSLSDSLLPNRIKLLAFSGLRLLSRGLVAAGVRSEVSSRKSPRLDATVARVPASRVGDPRATLPGADVALRCAELLRLTGLRRGTASGEDVLDGEGRKA